MQVDGTNIENALGSIVEIIQQNSPLKNEKYIELFKKHKNKIIEMVIEYNYFELIHGLLVIYPHSEEIIAQIICVNISKIRTDLLESISLQYPIIFSEFIKTISLEKLLYEWDKFMLVYNKYNLSEYKTFSDLIEMHMTTLIEKILFSVNKCFNNESFGLKKLVYNDFEKILFFTNIYLKNEKNGKNIDEIHLTIIENLLKFNETSNSKISNINIITKYINYFKISNTLIKIKLEKNKEIFVSVCKSDSIELINWYLEQASFLVLITKSNYVQIFKNACLSGNVEVSKLVFNLIQAAGYKIDKNTLYGIVNTLIYNQRWNSENYDDQIIIELISLDNKPPSGYTKYTDYYNNIKIIGKKYPLY